MTRALPIADLLHETPLVRIDTERTRSAVTLAFAGGTSGGLFDEALNNARFEPSGFDANSFAKDLFVSRFVAECFRIQVDSEHSAICQRHLLELLTRPPAGRATIEFRRSILADLVESPAHRAELEEVYRLLRRFRALLESSGAEKTWDPNRRQLDILAVLKRIVDATSPSFDSAKSGLRRLAAWGQAIRQSEPYSSLANLLSYDGRLATLNLKVGVGADGRIRGFDIVSVAERVDNPFVGSAWRRWLAKTELFLRGYRFSDQEVMARLIDAVFTGVEDMVVDLVQLVGDLEFYLGALAFRDRALAAGLETCLPSFVGSGEPRELLGLFNPLLLMSGVTPVPCDLKSERLASTVLVTGPNSGGKTRLLQSIGLSQLLAQVGAFVPARAGRLALAPALVVSLIEETRADQAEGRLGMELVRIRSLFERLPPGAMVLLDELCSGTNPSEGEEIFELVVSTLARLKPQVFITTHFLAFAARLERERLIPNLGFLQVELGRDRRATYQFVEGVAHSSLAGQTAERLGVTRDQLIALADENRRRFRQDPTERAEVA